MPEREPLTDADMVEILEDIIRNGGNAAARIAAIRQLREIRGSGEKPSSGGFAGLYDVDNPGRIRTKAAR